MPVSGATLVFSHGTQSARVVTDRAGRYRISLAQGTYKVRVLLRGVSQRVQPSTVRVGSTYARIGFLVDTGIR